MFADCAASIKSINHITRVSTPYNENYPCRFFRPGEVVRRLVTSVLVRLTCPLLRICSKRWNNRLYTTHAWYNVAVKDHRERESELKAHCRTESLLTQSSSSFSCRWLLTATLGLLCYVVSHILKGIYTTNGLLNRKCLNTPTELCPVLHPGMPIALPNYALCFILPLTLPHSRLNEVANLEQLE